MDIALSFVPMILVLSAGAIAVMLVNRKIALLRADKAALISRMAMLEGDTYDPDDPCDHCVTFGRNDGLRQCEWCGMTTGTLR